MRKILTIDDLLTFCEQQHLTRFDAQETGYRLCVTTPAMFEKSGEKDEFMLIGNVRLMHTNINRNGSKLTEKAAKECLSSIAYKPILANFCTVDGVDDFTSHDMEINDDGSVTYIEKQVGCFTADKPTIDKDPDEKGRKYIYAKAAIPREYTKAAEIIERKGGTKLSAELAINSMSYDTNEHCLILDSVTVMGATLLGMNPETGEAVQEGMEGARLDIADFSESSNSVFNNNRLIESLDRLTDMLSNFNIQADNAEIKPRKEEVTVVLDEVNDAVVVETNNEAATEEEETVVINNEETATEEITPEVVEVVTEEESVEDETTSVDNETTSVEDETTSDEDENETVENETTSDEDETVEDENEPVEGETASDEDETSSVEDEEIRREDEANFSVRIGDRVFELSLDEINLSINTLVNDMYSETDNTYYQTIVYAESQYVIMIDVFWGRAYKQNFKERKGVYSLIGERIPVKSVWVTSDEEAELDRIRSNYAAIETALNEYKNKELHEKRESILASQDYSVLVNYADFTALRENMDNYTPEELSEAADLIYAKFMKSNYGKFSANQQKDGGQHFVFMSSGEDADDKKREPYGGIFKDYFKKKRNK